MILQDFPLERKIVLPIRWLDVPSELKVLLPIFVLVEPFEWKFTFPICVDEPFGPKIVLPILW